jgi:trimethylamine--corrinoid protein Co-methyltransferase
MTISQLLHPGAPVIYGGSAGPVDLRFGTLAYGAPERNILLCANIDLANHFQLPHFSSAGSVDSISPDFQTGQAKALAWLTRMMKGTILGLWFGGLLTGNAVAPEQIVLDVDLYRAVQSILKGMPIDEMRMAYEAICRVGPGGSFLLDEHTLTYMRQGEYYLSGLVNMRGEQGSPMLDRAHAEVERLLADHESSVPPNVRQDLERMMVRFDVGK